MTYLEKARNTSYQTLRDRQPELFLAVLLAIEEASKNGNIEIVYDISKLIQDNAYELTMGFKILGFESFRFGSELHIRW